MPFNVYTTISLNLDSCDRELDFELKNNFRKTSILWNLKFAIKYFCFLIYINI